MNQEGYNQQYGGHGGNINSNAPEFNPYANPANYDANYGTNQYGEYNDPMANGYYDDGTGGQMDYQDPASLAQGSFYPLMPPYKPHHFQACPISAMAIDPVADALFIAGHTTLISRNRHHVGYPLSVEKRASMLVTQVLSSGTVYSACAAHAEAKSEILDYISSSIYGQSSKAAPNRAHVKVPNHAYRAPYDPVQSGTSQLAPYSKRNHLGITKILPFASKVSSGSNNANESEKTEGYHCSISPSSIRVHTRGGLQVSNSNLEGMVSGTFHPGMYQTDFDEKSISSSATNITVGGISTNKSGTNLFCLDLYSSSLRSVASHSVRSDNGSEKMCISDLVTNHQIGNVIAGCSDGTLRIFDGSWRKGNFKELTNVRAHSGGVVHVATAGNLICTTGYSSRSPTTYGTGTSKPYAFPDEHVLVFDIRYLGKGGIMHPFMGLKGGPRHVSFLPGEGNDGDQRILVCSGQPGGGIQIIRPFEAVNTGNHKPEFNDFLNLPLETTEAITAVSCVGTNLALGTNHGNVLQFCMDSHDQTKTGLSQESLDVPPLLDAPPLSIDPQLLQGSITHNALSISVFNPYVMCAEPMVSPTEANGYAFGPLSSNTLIPTGRRKLSKSLEQMLSSRTPDEYAANIQTSQLGLDIFKSNRIGKAPGNIMNANKLLHGRGFASVCYNINADPRKKDQQERGRDNNGKKLPDRYRNKDRPSNVMFTDFDFADLNNTLYPGYDYPSAMSNSFVSPVLLLLYFVPEIQNAMLFCQNWGAAADTRGKKGGKNSSLLTEELGFLFHQINSISSHAMCHPMRPGAKDKAMPCRPVVGTFTPSNFLSAFITMPEASALALLDNSPAATETARRPEAFYRFLLHHLDKELSGHDTARTTRREKKDSKHKTKLIDSLQGLDAVSMNEFVTGSGPPSASATRSYTVELSYEAFLNNSEETQPQFRQLLQYSLSKHVRLRAWCEATKKFETVVQRKIITSLPKILSLSCACAGTHGKDRLPIWRKTSDDYPHWLPEMIEIDIDSSGNIVTRELVKKYESSEPCWEEFQGKPLPDSVVSTLNSLRSPDTPTEPQQARYRLDMVLSYLNDKANEGGESSCGRHVVHSRIPKSYKKQILCSQLEHLKHCAKDADRVSKLTLLRDVTSDEFQKRMDYVEEQMKELDDEIEDEWVLFNGPNVSSTSVDDALAFHVSFKEPCLLVYRQIGTESNVVVDSNIDIPDRIWTESPLSPGVPTEGDILAFDAEFVQVENETSVLTASGSKVVSARGRNAVGRISLLESETSRELVDDHVIPREAVVDYLTRFSGITQSDLNPKTSSHHLISARNAYLKMRYLVDRGCKFVGHGLRQDFLTVNLFVPPFQIIDTVDIYRIENRRYISLRFLVNYLLGRDMQIEIHDSIEDSKAANELYLKALELKEKGNFEETLRHIYERGQQIDWKVAEINLK